MPLPKPGNDEEKEDFVSRCMDDEIMKEEYPDPEQRVAICYKLFEQKRESE